MQTHEDRDYGQGRSLSEFMGRLEGRAAKMMAAGESQITAGKPGEPTLDEWTSRNMHIKQLPPDEQGIIRVSVGGGIDGLNGDYCVFRGDRIKAAGLLARAEMSLRGRKPNGPKYDITESGPTPTPHMAQFEGYGVGQWCPTPDGSGKPEAVVLHIDFDSVYQFNGRACDSIGLRLKSRHAINTLLEILEKHRDEVFPF